jgi:hypothetical protein
MRDKDGTIKVKVKVKGKVNENLIAVDIVFLVPIHN